MSIYAPHPWDAVPAKPPKPGASYEEPVPTSRKYLATFEYEATIEVANASELDEDEILRVLEDAHQSDAMDNGRLSGTVSVVEVDDAYKADYTVRIVDGEAETLP
jgi:hypothetical protein